jgi:hypothetical protein
MKLAGKTEAVGSLMSHGYWWLFARGKATAV